MDSDVVAQLQGKFIIYYLLKTISQGFNSDYLYTTARVTAREEHIRESWVRAMEAKLVRDELNKCQRTEGVNHYETCKYLADRYIEMLRENRVC